MTEDQKRSVALLSYVTFLPASWDKRFYKAMLRHSLATPEKPLTDKQAACLDAMVHRYRRQHKKCLCLECLKAHKAENPFQAVLFEEDKVR